MFCRGPLYRFLLVHHNLRLQIRLHLITFTMERPSLELYCLIHWLPIFCKNTLTFSESVWFVPNLFNTKLSWALGGLLPACVRPCFHLYLLEERLQCGNQKLAKQGILPLSCLCALVVMHSGWGQIGG